MAEPIEENTLIQRVRERDADALLVLYRIHGPRVFSLAYRMLGDRSTAEEVVQDTFWKFWQRPAMYDPQKGVLIAWLYTVARNLAVDRKRKGNRRFFEDVFDIEEQIKGTVVPEVAAVADPLVAGAIQRAIDSLPSEQKVAIELAYFEGFTHTEIADRLGEALGTVKTRLRLGLSKLREAMREHGKVRR